MQKGVVIVRVKAAQAEKLAVRDRMFSVMRIERSEMEVVVSVVDRGRILASEKRRVMSKKGSSFLGNELKRWVEVSSKVNEDMIVAVTGDCNLSNGKLTRKTFLDFNGIQTNGLFVNATVLYQLSCEDPYIGRRPIC